MIAVISVLLFVFFDNQRICEGDFLIINKYIEGGTCFFQVELDNTVVTLKCNSEIYKELKCLDGYLYHLKFSYNEIYPERGYLIEIDVRNPLDIKGGK